MNFESLRAQTTYLSPTINPEEPLFEFGCIFYLWERVRYKKYDLPW